MRVSTVDLRKAIEVVLAHLDDLGQTEFEIKADFYWDAPSEQRYDCYSEPKLTMGQLSDDLSHIRKIVSGEEEPLGYALVWIASILRAVGEESVG